jgi:hypothetical protein
MADFVKRITEGNRKLIAFLVASGLAFCALFVVRNYPNAVGLYGGFGGLIVSALGIMTMGNASEHKAKTQALIAQSDVVREPPLVEELSSGRAG